jgi:hypothetical protein
LRKEVVVLESSLYTRFDQIPEFVEQAATVEM